jgi:hypothetical protein
MGANRRGIGATHRATALGAAVFLLAESQAWAHLKGHFGVIADRFNKLLAGRRIAEAAGACFLGFHTTRASAIAKAALEGKPQTVKSCLADALIAWLFQISARQPIPEPGLFIWALAS